MATPACPLLLIPGDVDELGYDDLDRYRRVTARWGAAWHPVDPAGPEHRRARLWWRPLPGPRRRSDVFQPSRQAIRRRRRQIRPGRPM
jgi:hypothetical protein